MWHKTKKEGQQNKSLKCQHKTLDSSIDAQCECGMWMNQNLFLSKNVSQSASRAKPQSWRTHFSDKMIVMLF